MFENLGSLSLALADVTGETRTMFRSFRRCDARDFAALWPEVAGSWPPPRLKADRRSLMSSVELGHSNDAFFTLLFLASWGRCYDHNFRRFFPFLGDFPNFRRKNGVFLKYQCYDQIFAQFSFELCQKRHFFLKDTVVKTT
jgi:hypothetical protein